MAKSGRKSVAPNAGVAALAANVEETAAKVAVVLGHFKTTLQQSGMSGAVDAYRKMTDTLINQRLWMGSHGQEGGEEHFRRIAAEAREIHEVLHAYSDIMGKLMLLPQLLEATDEPKAGAPPESENRADRLMAWLRQQLRPVSATQIRTALRLSTAELNMELKQLGESGRIVKMAAAGRELYSAVRGL